MSCGRLISKKIWLSGINPPNTNETCYVFVHWMIERVEDDQWGFGHNCIVTYSSQHDPTKMQWGGWGLLRTDK